MDSGHFGALQDHYLIAVPELTYTLTLLLNIKYETFDKHSVRCFD